MFVYVHISVGEPELEPLNFLKLAGARAGKNS